MVVGGKTRRAFAALTVGAALILPATPPLFSSGSGLQIEVWAIEVWALAPYTSYAHVPGAPIPMTLVGETSLPASGVRRPAPRRHWRERPRLASHSGSMGCAGRRAS